MKRRTLLAVGTGSLLAAPSVIRAQASNGVALVIGNSKYQWEAALPNVRRDAPDIAKSFQALGLKTELIQDVGRDGLLAALAKFKSAASGANLAAFYFAGHGVTWAKQTYVVPVTYAYDGEAIYAHSLEGLKLALMRKNPHVCFEVEDVQGMADLIAYLMQVP